MRISNIEFVALRRAQASKDVHRVTYITMFFLSCAAASINAYRTPEIALDLDDDDDDDDDDDNKLFALLRRLKRIFAHYHAKVHIGGPYFLSFTFSKEILECLLRAIAIYSEAPRQDNFITTIRTTIVGVNIIGTSSLLLVPQPLLLLPFDIVTDEIYVITDVYSYHYAIGNEAQSLAQLAASVINCLALINTLASLHRLIVVMNANMMRAAATSKAKAGHRRLSATLVEVSRRLSEMMLPESESRLDDDDQGASLGDPSSSPDETAAICDAVNLDESVSGDTSSMFKSTAGGKVATTFGDKGETLLSSPDDDAAAAAPTKATIAIDKVEGKGTADELLQVEKTGEGDESPEASNSDDPPTPRPAKDRRQSTTSGAQQFARLSPFKKGVVFIIFAIGIGLMLVHIVRTWKQSLLCEELVGEEIYAESNPKVHYAADSSIFGPTVCRFDHVKELSVQGHPTLTALPEAMRLYTGLTTFDLRNNGLVAVSMNVLGLPLLTALLVSENPVAKALNLTGQRVVKLPAVVEGAFGPTLRKLELRDCQLVAVPLWLRGLNVLDLRDNDQLPSDALPYEVFKGVATLLLHGTPLAKEIDWSGQRGLTEATMPSFARMYAHVPGLAALNLSNCAFGEGFSISDLVSELPELRLVDLRGSLNASSGVELSIWRPGLELLLDPGVVTRITSRGSFWFNLESSDDAGFVALLGSQASSLKEVELEDLEFDQLQFGQLEVCAAFLRHGHANAANEMRSRFVSCELACEEGSWVSVDGVGNQSAVCAPCSAGYDCPPGSLTTMGIGKCARGTYFAEGAATRCQNCSAGFYCPFEGATTAKGNGTCDSGFYCPEGSTSPTGVGSCPPGEYTKGSASCKKCYTGFYCPFEGATAPTGNGTCDVLRHCPAGSTSSFGVGQCEDTVDSSSPCPRPLFSPLNRDELKGAVDAWINDQTTPAGTYGDIQDWDTSRVTSMRFVCCERVALRACVPLGGGRASAASASFAMRAS